MKVKQSREKKYYNIKHKFDDVVDIIVFAIEIPICCSAFLNVHAVITYFESKSFQLVHIRYFVNKQGRLIVNGKQISHDQLGLRA